MHTQIRRRVQILDPQLTEKAKHRLETVGCIGCEQGRAAEDEPAGLLGQGRDVITEKGEDRIESAVDCDGGEDGRGEEGDAGEEKPLDLRKSTVERTRWRVSGEGEVGRGVMPWFLR